MQNFSILSISNCHQSDIQVTRLNPLHETCTFGVCSDKEVKAPKQLSDTELNRRIKRLELEKKYNELNNPYKSDGKKYVDDILQGSGKTVVGAIVGGAAGFFVQRELRRRFG